MEREQPGRSGRVLQDFRGQTLQRQGLPVLREEGVEAINVLLHDVKEIDAILAENKNFEERIGEFDANFNAQMKDLHKNLNEGIRHIQNSTRSIRDLERINDATRLQMDQLTATIHNIELGI